MLFLDDSEEINITVYNHPQVEIIIDNSDPGFQLSGSGLWYTRENPPYQSYGPNFVFNGTGSGKDKAIFSFSITEPGEYDVFAWWPSNTICSPNTPYSIPFSDGQVTIRVNQQQNSDQWNFLASGHFEQGNYQIIISDNADPQVVVADAVRIVSKP